MLDPWIKRWSWLNLHLASGVQERLRRRLTMPGQALLAATLTAGLFGIDTRQTQAYQVFALGLALLLVGLASNGRRPVGLRAARRLPRYAAVGEPCDYRARVTNLGRQTLRGLELSERLPDPRPARAVFLRTRAPFEARLNPFERLFGYPRWDWLVRRAQGVERPAPVPLPDLPPGESLEVGLRLLPTRRGLLRLEGLTLSRTGLLGLTRRETSLADADRLLVLPRRYPVRPPAPPGRRRLQPGGITQAAAVGESREFIGLRDYLPGDSPRHIHWAAWARCGEPVVKEYQDEYFSRQALVLDTCAAGDAAGFDAFECGVTVAASLVEPLANGPGGQDALLDLIFVADQAHSVTAGRGLLAGIALLETLAALEPAPADGIGALADRVIGEAPHLSACLCVLLDWDPPRQRLVTRLRALGVPVRVLLIAAADQTIDPGPLADAPGLLLRIDPADPGAGLARF